jgi:hypothetical protein
VENVERTQFVVLAGHLDEQPLPDLIRRLRVQRKTGRLQVEYAEGPGAFFFEEGQLVDAQLGQLRGVEALYAALSLGGASFNFNPLVRPPERSIDRQGQRFIEDLVEGPRREGLAELRVAGREVSDAALPQRGDVLQLPPVAELVAPLEERLTAVEEAINNTARRFSRERLVYAVVISFLAGLSLVATLGAIFYPSGPTQRPPAAAQPSQTTPAEPAAQKRAPAAQTNEGKAATSSEGEDAATVPSAASVIGTRKFEGASAPRGAYVVQVLVKVENGRVTDARVWNPRPGAEAYEAVALRMARERRYPEQFSGGERLRIRVQP